MPLDAAKYHLILYTQMDEVEIPADWRKCVCDILRTRDGSRIRIVNRAKHEWDAAFPMSFAFDLYNALLDALEVEGVTGKRVTGMLPPGEVWAFWFVHEGQRLYGKVNLLEGKLSIMVYSAHRPLKGDKL